MQLEFEVSAGQGLLRVIGVRQEAELLQRPLLEWRRRIARAWSGTPSLSGAGGGDGVGGGGP